MSFWTLTGAIVAALLIVTAIGTVITGAAEWLTNQRRYRNTAPRDTRTAKQTERDYLHNTTQETPE